jgi:hypothetical protein
VQGARAARVSGIASTWRLPLIKAERRALACGPSQGEAVWIQVRLGLRHKLMSDSGTKEVADEGGATSQRLQHGRVELVRVGCWAAACWTEGSEESERRGRDEGRLPDFQQLGSETKRDRKGGKHER